MSSVVAMSVSALSLLLFYAVMAALLFMLWRLTKDLDQIKRSLAELQQAVALLDPRAKPGS